MDWTSILTAVGTFVAGGGLTSLIQWRINKKKASIEVDSAAVATMKDAIEEVRDTNRELNEIHDKDTATIERKNVEIRELTATNATVSMLVCRHVGCSLREPIYGSGTRWFEKYKDDISLGIDHTPVNVLLRMQGRKKKESDTEAAEKDSESIA